MYKRNKVVERK